MKVKDLIKELRKQNPNHKVFLADEISNLFYDEILISKHEDETVLWGFHQNKSKGAK